MWLWIFEIVALIITDLSSFEFGIKKKMKKRKKNEEKKQGFEMGQASDRNESKFLKFAKIVQSLDFKNFIVQY